MSVILAVGLLLGSATRGEAYVAGKDGPVLRMTVNFFEAEKFADVGNRSNPSPADRERVLTALKEFLIQQACRVIPATHQLIVTVTDLDQAGSFEPWHGPGFDDIRIVKDLYPPRLELVFRLTDAQGNIVREGRRELRDPAFLMKLSVDQHDHLRHEKALIEDWLRAEFGHAK